jgi:hypothetical protein
VEHARALARKKVGVLGKVCGLREKEKRKKSGPGKRWAAREKWRGQRGFGDFFLNSFQIHFQTFKLHSNNKPCIRIMMHKHLLFLTLLK